MLQLHRSVLLVLTSQSNLTLFHSCHQPAQNFISQSLCLSVQAAVQMMQMQEAMRAQAAMDVDSGRDENLEGSRDEQVLTLSNV